MKLSQLVTGLMTKLAVIPGLNFLQTYVISARQAHTKFGQRVGDYEAYVAGARGAYSDVRQATGGAADGQQASPADGGAAAPQAGFEDEVVDYYDLYDDPDPSMSGSERFATEDDYPAADDHMSYHDDDYGNP